jgi:lysophospholipase L1-like esterase
MKFKRVSLLLIIMLAFSTFFTSFAFAEENIDKPNLVALGDSITFGWNLDDTNGNTQKSSKAFPNLIIENSFFDVTNISGGGWTSGKLLSEIAKPENAAAIQAADVVSLDIGSNDLLQAPEIVKLRENPPGPETTPEELAAIQQKILAEIDGISKQLAGNLGQTVGLIKNLNPEAVIIFYNLYNPYGVHTGLFNSLGEQIIPAMNAQIYAPLAAQLNLELADAYSAFNGKQAQLIFPYPDVHPNEVGQQVLADLATNILLSYLPEELTITLTAAPGEETTGPVTINVNTNAEEVTVMKWLPGEKTVEDFYEAGTEIVDHAFQVTDNGTYTVYILDGFEQEAVQTITIDNIKAEAPPVENPDPVAPAPTPTTPAPPATGTGHPIPNTATPAYNFVAMGAVILLAGFVTLQIQKRRRQEV